MQQLDFENIDFEEMLPSVDVGDMDFEGTGPISLPELPKEESFTSKVKQEQAKFFDFEAKFPQIKEKVLSDIKESLEAGQAEPEVLDMEVPTREPGIYPESPETIVDKVSNLIRNVTKASKDKASVTLALAEHHNISPSQAEEEYEALTADVPGQPSSIELYTGLLTLPIVAGLMTNPIAAIAGLTGFMALGEAESFIISKAKKKPYMFGEQRGLVDLAPSDINERTKFVLDTIDFIGKGAILGGAFSKIRKTSWYRRMNNRERGLVALNIAEMKKANLDDAQILKVLSKRRDPEYKSYFTEAVKKRGLPPKEAGRVGKPAEPITPPPPPPVEAAKPKPETKLAKKFEGVIKAEREAPPLNILKARELEIDKGQIDFEKVEPVDKPVSKADSIAEKPKTPPTIEVKVKGKAEVAKVEKAPEKVGEKIEPSKGVFDPKKPPVEPEGSILSAIRMKDGTIYYDKAAKVHADMLESLKIDAAEIKDTGIIKKGEYEIFGGTIMPKVRQAEAQKILLAKRAKVKPTPKAKDTIESLTQEARKYKTVEEFVERTHTKFYRMQDTMTASDRKLAEEFYKADKEALYNQATRPTPTPKAKEAWEMSFKETWEEMSGKEFDKYAKLADPEKYEWYQKNPLMDDKVRHQDLHETIVKKAHSEGKLKSHPDYPELGKVEGKGEVISKPREAIEPEIVESSGMVKMVNKLKREKKSGVKLAETKELVQFEGFGPLDDQKIAFIHHIKHKYDKTLEEAKAIADGFYGRRLGVNEVRAAIAKEVKPLPKPAPKEIKPVVPGKQPTKLVILKDKKKILSDIDKAIVEAPAEAKTTKEIYEASVGWGKTERNIQITEAQFKKGSEAVAKELDFDRVGLSKRQVPSDYVKLDIDGGANIVNTKDALTEFKKRIDKTKQGQTISIPKAKAPVVPKPIAAKREEIGDLHKLKQKGWFTDGHVLIKGEPPKGKVVPKEGKEMDIDMILPYMAYDKTQPAELMYYSQRDLDIGTGISKEPLPDLGDGQYPPSVSFKVGDNYSNFNQAKFRALANRFPDAEYRINPNNGMVVAYQGIKPVGGVMPFRADEVASKEFPQLAAKPTMKEEAVEAGFIKGKPALLKKAEPEPLKPKAEEPTLKPGFVWVKNKQKPFTEYREITKGKDKNKVEVVLPDGKKVTVGKEAVRVWPEKGVEVKLEPGETVTYEKQQKEDVVELFSGIPFLKVDPWILKPLRDLYTGHIGDPLWNFLSETLPVEAGKRSRFVDAINKGLIWDYRKDPKFTELRDDTYMKIQQCQEKAKEIAHVMAKFSRAEQIRIAQIIKGGVTAAPKRYESAFEAIERFQELEKDLQELGILGLDNRFRQLTRKEIADKFKEIKDHDVQIEKLRKKLQPIEKIGRVARRISEDVSEEIVSTSETEGMYKVDETKWTELNEGRIKEALMSRGFAEGEVTQMINRVKESVTPLEGQKGTLKEIKTKVEKVVTKTVLQEIIKTRTYHPAMMARARGSLIKDINKVANKRSEILERIRLHYKMSGKLYLRRAYEKIEGEKTFLKNLLSVLKIRKTRLKKGYEIRRKDLSVEYREKVLGEIKKAPYLVYKGLSEESHDAELMRMFGRISKNKNWAISPEEWANIQTVKARHHLIPKYENFKPLPVTEKLGPLSGALIDPYIWDDLNEAVKVKNEMIKAWDSVLSLWKVGKAVYNPATQCRNILSNSILADFAGLPQHRIDIYARTALDFYTKSGYWLEAKKHTPLLGTEWAAVEAMEFLKATSELKEGNWLTASAKLAAKYLDKPGKMYQFSEQFFKLAVYTNERLDGATIKEAYKHAEKYIFNYQKIPSAIRRAKRWWSPFITFSYKAIPRFAETVIRQPWKIAKYGLLMAAVEEITRRMFGESEEQVDREKRVLPDYMRKTTLPGQLSHVRVPYKDEYGRSKYLDLSFILPWGDIAEQWGQSFLVGRPFLPNHPAYVFVAEVGFDQIFFTGQDLTDKELDEGLPYWTKLGEQLWRQAMPSLAGSYAYNKLMAAYKGEKDWALRDRSITEAAFDVFFGLKIRSIDYNESHARLIGQLRSKINLAKKRFKKDYWKIVINPTPDAEYDARRQRKLWVRLNKDIDRIMEKITEIEK